MPCVAAGLFPHPPVMIPDIGGKDTQKVKQTIDHVKAAMARIMKEHPDTVVVMSPHNICFSDGPSLLLADTLSGDMGAFGHPELSMTLPVDQTLAGFIGQKADPLCHLHHLDRKEAARYKKSIKIDWGSFVPLYYLLQAGFQGKIVLLTPDSSKRENNYVLGAILRETAQKLHRSIAVIATGDLSHKLTKESPHGFSPKGTLFDETIMKALQTRDKDMLDKLSDPLLKEIDTCGLSSIYFLLGVLGDAPASNPFISHEGPFGVGYGVALYLPQEEVQKEKSPLSEHAKLAKDAIAHYIRTGRFLRVPTNLSEDLRIPSGVRITLLEFGATRGSACSKEPQYHSLAEEIIHVAKAAATEDPTHPPVSVSELEDLEIRVEPIHSKK